MFYIKFKIDVSELLLLLLNKSISIFIYTTIFTSTSSSEVFLALS